MIKQQSETDWKEMYQVFNMGHRMEIYTDANTAGEIIRISQSFDVDAQIVGRCEESTEKLLTIKTAQGDFVYS
jgi:phosphoribosylformylglycinamidine cyclo-ligase